MPHNQTSHPPITTPITDPGQERGLGGGSRQQKSSAQLRCEAKGGEFRWDPKTNTCVHKRHGWKFGFKLTEEERAGMEKGDRVITDRHGGERIRTAAEEKLLRQEAEWDLATRGQVTASMAMKAQDEAREMEERERVMIEEETPERRELDPIMAPREDFPVIGPLLTKIQEGIISLARIGTPGIDIEGPNMPDQLQPEELRTVALTQIEREEITRGLTNSEKFGSFIESLNVGELKKFIPGAAGAELPSENVATVLKSLRILKSRAIDVELKYKKGLIRTRSSALARLTEIENEIQRGESRMKMLIQGSPELKFNSDGVNFIELKILEARERLFDSKIAVEFGDSGSPEDIEILLAQQRDIVEEDFEIPG